MTAEWFAIATLTVMSIVQGAALFFLWVELKAMQKSTHSIQYIDPLSKDKLQEIGDKVRSKLHEDVFENIV